MPPRELDRSTKPIFMSVYALKVNKVSCAGGFEILSYRDGCFSKRRRWVNEKTKNEGE